MKEEDFGLLPVILPGKRLRVGGITYFMREGQLVACASRRRKREKRTEGEREMSGRFAEVQRLWKVYRLATGNLPVWQVAAREQGAHRGHGLFMRFNSGCVREGEGVWAFDGFRFATGSLDVPLLRGARRVGEGAGSGEGSVGKVGAGVGGAEGGVRVELVWERGEDGGGVRWGDRVYVGYFSGVDGRSPGMVACEGVRRGDGRAEVVVPLERGEEEAPLHVYLFFGTADGTRFSPSVYVRV